MTFHSFSLLPPELREMIWQYHIPTVGAFVAPLRPHCWREKAVTVEFDHKRLPGRKVTIPIAGVCREARRLVIATLPPAKMLSSTVFSFHFNSDQDVLRAHDWDALRYILAPKPGWWSHKAAVNRTKCILISREFVHSPHFRLLFHSWRISIRDVVLLVAVDKPWPFDIPGGDGESRDDAQWEYKPLVGHICVDQDGHVRLVCGSEEREHNMYDPYLELLYRRAMNLPKPRRYISHYYPWAEIRLVQPVRV